MAKVQKPLPGLAKFMGIETQGILRLEALDSVQPVLEVEDYLGPNPFQISRTSFTAGNQDAEFVVPANRFWRLKWLSYSFAPNVGQAINFVPYLKKTFQATTFVMPLSPTLPSLSAAGLTYQGNLGEFSGVGIALNLLNAYPGDAVGIRLSAATGLTAFNADLYLQYQELEL